MLLKKFIVYCISFIVLAFSASTASAQTTATPAALPATVSPTSPLYTDLLLHNMFHSFSCVAIGQSVIGQPCLTYEVTKNAEGTLQGIPVLSQANFSGGALGAATSLIGGLYENPPVRTAYYLASVGQGLGIVKTANAQVVGSGAAVLNPILKLWQTSRNIAYILMIIIFLVIGLMIIFRNKINPQTVISAQAALPGLIIGLVMITFSYFFAGLISDMAFVGTNVVGYYFVAAQGQISNPDWEKQLNLTEKLKDSNILYVMGSMTGIIDSGQVANFSGKIFESLGEGAKSTVHWLVFWLSNQFLSPMIPKDISTSPWGLLIAPVTGIILGTIVSATLISPLLGQLLSLAAALALVYQMLKLFFKLIMAWLTIIFLTITAPFQFLFASLPGRQGLATGWMLSMLGNILIFPAVVAVLYFAAFLLGPKLDNDCPKGDDRKCLIRVETNKINDNDFVRPAYAADGAEIISERTFPLFGGIDLSFIRILLAFGALMALPTIPDIITKTVGRAGQAGQMIGQEIMGGARFGQGYAQRQYQAGIGSAQDFKTGLVGETQVDAYGNVNLVRQGLVRRGVGTVSQGEKLDPAVVTQGPTAGRYVAPWRRQRDIKS